MYRGVSASVVCSNSISFSGHESSHFPAFFTYPTTPPHHTRSGETTGGAGECIDGAGETIDCAGETIGGAGETIGGAG